MWDPTVGPVDLTAIGAALVYAGKYVKDRMNGGTTRDRLIRIESNQQHFKTDMTKLEDRVEKLEDRAYG